MKFIALVCLSVLSFQLQAQSYTRALCLAQGTSVGGNDMGAFTADARLSLMIMKSDDGVLSLTAEGLVMVAQAFEEVSGPLALTPENSYIGAFKIPVTEENQNYRPKKYKGYAQFKPFDAEITVGNESGMWGDFVIEKTYLEKESFRAIYIFQAGDHLGGSLFFTCKKAE